MTSNEATDAGSVAARQLENVLAGLSRVVTRTRVQRSLLPDGSRLSPTEAWLLRYLAETGPHRMSDLAAWQGVDRSTMTAQIRRLERLGLAERVEDPTDRRAFLVHLTDAGRREHLGVVRTATQVCARILDGWTAAERTQLTDSLGRLVAEFEHLIREDAQ